MPVYELITFNPNGAVLTDAPKALEPAIKFFSTVDGFHALYFGVAAEDKNVAFIVIIWGSHEHQKAAIDTPGYPSIVGLAGTIAGNSTVVHVQFREPPEATLSSTITEVAVLTLKPGKTLAELNQILGTLAPLVAQEDGCEAEATWGVTKEDKKKTVLFAGWVSIERHFEIASQAKYKPLTDALTATVDVVFHHAPFTKLI